MRVLVALLVFVELFFWQSAWCEESQLTPEEQQYISMAKEIWNSLDRKQGKVELPNKVATLNVPDSFYYLSPKDSEKILVKVWNNPPGSGKGLLGMLLPVETSPFGSDSWGVTIGYEEDGYVSDEDAAEIDYDELLSQMKQSTSESSTQRVKQGYDPIKLVGWASPPFYDKESHKLHWAKEIKFGDDTVNTLNYNIRILGRKGVLLMNFIAGMNQKQMIDSHINEVLATADFNQGSRYQDFDPSIDKVAAYGIGALIAGKVIAKTGLLAAALIFLKKFGILIVVAIAAMFRKLFRKKSAENV